MGLQDVPRGVTARSSLLIATASVRSADTETQGVRIRFDLGPGFGIGIHGYYMRQTEAFDTDADQFDMTLVLDPDIALTTSVASSDPRILVRNTERLLTQITTSGATTWYAITPKQWTTFPAPILTVRDMTFQVVNNLTGSTDNEAIAGVLYSIYEISDAEFVRIAGVSLARG